jgi:hypothetical protein
MFHRPTSLYYFLSRCGEIETPNHLSENLVSMLKTETSSGKFSLHMCKNYGTMPFHPSYMSRYFEESTFLIFEKRDVDIIHVQGLFIRTVYGAMYIATCNPVTHPNDQLGCQRIHEEFRTAAHIIPLNRLSGKIRGRLHITKHIGSRSRCCRTPSGSRISVPEPITQLCCFADQPSDMHVPFTNALTPRRPGIDKLSIAISVSAKMTSL